MKLYRKKPDYGVDAPQMGITIIVFVMMLIIAGIFLNSIKTPLAQSISAIIFSVAPTGVIVIILIVLYIKVEKFRHRNKMLNMLTWKGDEQVLDVGTGKGLLMIGAAKRLTTGKSYGIDIWNKSDLSNNNYDAAIHNAEVEGVKDKVEIRNANAMSIPFPDNSFDYVLSNLCIHNIKAKEDRAKACYEISRVLKPQGVALISDFMYTKDYEKEFKYQQMKTQRLFSFLIAPVLLHIVRAEKQIEHGE